MRILAVDPGAERCGWAILDPIEGSTVPVYVDSGILQYRRNNMVFQEYRVLLEQASWWKFNSLFDEYQPSVVVNEIIPAVSANSNFVLATQSYLANVVVTMLHANAVFHNTEIHQIAARQVHSTIVTNRKKGQKVTKLQVCNSVVELVPSLAQRRGEWAKSKHWDESDAIAIGIAYVKLHQ